LSDNDRKSGADVLTVLVDITCLRRGPDDLPVSLPLLLGFIAASVLPDALLLTLLPKSFKGSPVGLIAIGIVIPLVWYGFLLQMAGKPERLLQTLTAMFGFQLVLAPALVFSGWFFVTYQQDPTWQIPAMMLRLVVEIWVLIVLSRILRSATEWPMFSCVVLAIANELLEMVIIAMLFPQPAAVPA
jgi:hypothetical protein